MDQRRQQFAAKRVVETGGDDADKITAASDHRPGDDIHLIAQGFRGAQHLLPGLLRHRGAGGEGCGETAERETPASLATSSALIHFLSLIVVSRRLFSRKPTPGRASVTHTA